MAWGGSERQRGSVPLYGARGEVWGGTAPPFRSAVTVFVQDARFSTRGDTDRKTQRLVARSWRDVSSPVRRPTHPTSICSPGWRRSTSRAASSDVLKGRRGRLPLTGGAADLLCTAADGRRSWKVRAHGSRHAVHRRRRLVTRGRGSVAFDVAAAANCSARRSPGDERQHAAAATSA